MSSYISKIKIRYKEVIDDMILEIAKDMRDKNEETTKIYLWFDEYDPKREPDEIYYKDLWEIIDDIKSGMDDEYIIDEFFKRFPDIQPLPFKPRDKRNPPF